MIQPALLQIEFGIRPGVSEGRAFLARRNRFAAISTRWTAGVDPNELVYSLEQQHQAPISIDITLRTDSPVAKTIWIRTRLAWPSSRALGVVSPTAVSVPKGCHDITITAELAKVALDASGVSRSVAAWCWEWADSENGTYLEFARSEHRLYVIAGEPQYPWRGQAAGPGEVVWTDVLDWSCRWAAGTHTAADAAAAVTRRIHELGELGFTTSRKPETFQWEGRTHHFYGTFRCVAFLSLLHGETRKVAARGNCSDLAVIVATFANVLGSRLEIFRVQAQGGEWLDLNEFRAIGFDRAATASRLPNGFPYHDVAGERDAGTPTRPVRVFDACVAVDMDARPERPPSCWAPPAGMARAEYEKRFVRSTVTSGLRWCSWEAPPIEGSFTAVIPAPPPLWTDRFHAYRSMLENPGRAQSIPGSAPLDTYEFSPGPILTRSISSRSNGQIEEQVWTAEPADPAAATVYISVFPCHSLPAAREMTAEILAWCQFPFLLGRIDGAPPILLDTPGGIGGFATQHQAVIVEGHSSKIDAFTAALALLLQQRRMGSAD